MSKDTSQFEKILKITEYYTLLEVILPETSSKNILGFMSYDFLASAFNVKKKLHN